MSVFPIHYFMSSPYMLKEMNAALLDRAPFMMRKHRQAITKLRKGDSRCTHLIDDKDRVILSPAVPLPTRLNSRNQSTQKAVQDEQSSESEDETETTQDVQVEETTTPTATDSVVEESTASLSIDTAAAVPPSTLRVSPSSSSLPHPALSPSSSSSFRYPDRPLLLFWLDGAQRYLPFNLALHTLTTFPSPSIPHPLALVAGGSLGLRSTILDHKTSMHQLLTRAGRTYIPQTKGFTVGEEGWREEVEGWMSEGEEGDFAIVKPSEGLKQKGILVVRREAENVEQVLTHVNEWAKYDDWVLQTLVTDPFCISGLDIGLVKGSSPPTALYATEEQRQVEEVIKVEEAVKGKEKLKGQKGRRKTLEPITNQPLKPKRFTFPAVDAFSPSDSSPNKRKKKGRVPPLRNPSQTASSPDTSSSPSSTPSSVPSLSPLSSPPADSTYPRAAAGQLASDSGTPVDCLGLYKVHFRVYAMLRYDSIKDENALFICDLFKLYHAPAPSAVIIQGREKEPLSSKLVTAMTNTQATLLSLSSLPSDSPILSLSNPSSPTQSISNSLAMRLGNDILSPALIAHFWPSFTSIITDCISLALPHLTPYPHLSTHSFQLYGFDLLWDVKRDEAVLLEVNENVGQGIHKREVMCGQGMEVREYERMKRMWKDEYRRGFSEGLLNVTVDEAIGKERDEGNVWKEIKRWQEGKTYRGKVEVKRSRPSYKVRKAKTNTAEPIKAKVEMETPVTACDAPVLVASAPLQRRRSSHRQLAAALEHAQSTAQAESSKPFLTGQPRAFGSVGDGVTRPTRAELLARYAVKARRRSVTEQTSSTSNDEHQQQPVEERTSEGKEEVSEAEVGHLSSDDGRVLSSSASDRPSSESSTGSERSNDIDRREGTGENGETPFNISLPTSSAPVAVCG